MSNGYTVKGYESGTHIRMNNDEKISKTKSHWAVGRQLACGQGEATSSNDLQKKHKKATKLKMYWKDAKWLEKNKR